MGKIEEFKEKIKKMDTDSLMRMLDEGQQSRKEGEMIVTEMLKRLWEVVT